jgi:hypothetical protein
LHHCLKLRTVSGSRQCHCSAHCLLHVHWGPQGHNEKLTRKSAHERSRTKAFCRPECDQHCSSILHSGAERFSVFPAKFRKTSTAQHQHQTFCLRLHERNARCAVIQSCVVGSAAVLCGRDSKAHMHQGTCLQPPNCYNSSFQSCLGELQTHILRITLRFQRTNPIRIILAYS